MQSQFIPFYNIEQTKKSETPKNELLTHAISISVESGKLLEDVFSNKIEDIKKKSLKLRESLDLLIKEIDKPIEINYGTQTIYSGDTSQYYNKEIEVSKVTHDEFNKSRVLNNGGLRPPKEWKSITEINLKNSEKNNLIEEMRRLKDNGINISKSNFHHKQPISIEEFTEPFKYVENMHDYNGSFLITLLKSEIEINNHAFTFQVDLSEQKKAYLNGDNIILSVYDITGSPSNGEEKKFLIVLNFDKLNGVLNFSHAIFMNGEKFSFSSRQLNEIGKFCKAKKINSHPNYLH